MEWGSNCTVGRPYLTLETNQQPSARTPEPLSKGPFHRHPKRGFWWAWFSSMLTCLAEEVVHLGHSITSASFFFPRCKRMFPSVVCSNAEETTKSAGRRAGPLLVGAWGSKHPRLPHPTASETIRIIRASSTTSPHPDLNPTHRAPATSGLATSRGFTAEPPPWCR